MLRGVPSEWGVKQFQGHTLASAARAVGTIYQMLYKFDGRVYSGSPRIHPRSAPRLSQVEPASDPCCHETEGTLVKLMTSKQPLSPSRLQAGMTLTTCCTTAAVDKANAASMQQQNKCSHSAHIGPCDHPCYIKSIHSRDQAGHVCRCSFNYEKNTLS